jgi:hypothetical protein
VFVGKKKNILESLHESGVVLPAEKCFHLHGQLQRWWILESLDHELALDLDDQSLAQEDSGACVYYMRMIHAHVYYIQTRFSHLFLVICSAPLIFFFQWKNQGALFKNCLLSCFIQIRDSVPSGTPSSPLFLCLSLSLSHPSLPFST